MGFTIIEPLVVRKQSEVPFVSVSPVTSRITINQAAMKILVLEKALSVVYNDDNKSYYLCKGIGSKSFPVRIKLNKSDNSKREGTVTNGDLSLKLREAYGKIDETKTFRLHINPIFEYMGDNKLYKLIATP